MGATNIVDLIPSPFVEAIYIPSYTEIAIFDTQFRNYVAGIPVHTDIGRDCVGFAFSQNFTKLIVAGKESSDLYWYSVVKTATDIVITYQGVYTGVGFPVDGLVQSSPAVGDFIVMGSDFFLGNQAAYVDDGGATSGVHSVGLSFAGWQVGETIYQAWGDGLHPTTRRKSVSSDEPDPDAGWETVATFTGIGLGGFSLIGLSEVLPNGTVYQAGVLDDVYCLVELDSGGGTVISLQFPADPNRMGPFASGIPWVISSYLYPHVHCYYFHSDVAPDYANRIWKYNLPISFEAGLDIGGGGPDFFAHRPHCYLWAQHAGGGGLPPETLFPGLSRYNASTAAEEFFERT